MKIGLTYTGSAAKHDNYARWLKAGEEIVIIKLSAEDDNLAAVNDCDALVLSGGVDIHPSFYGGPLDYSPGISKAPVGAVGPEDRMAPASPVKWKEERDRFELAALERALEQGKPVLGVCRGLQLINVFCGGTLVQDLGERGDETHQNWPADQRRPGEPTDKQHSVTIEKGTMLFAIAGQGGEANSAHHQAIDRLGKGLRVNCRAEDGTIEGIEWADPHDKPFILAVQWHPERMFTNGFRDKELYMNIRNRFMEEIKKTTEQ